MPLRSLSMNFVAHNSTKSFAMAPQHSFLFDMPFRFVVGTGITAGTVWALFKPTDVALAEEVSKKPKVLVRTASGAVCPSLPRTPSLPRSRSRTNPRAPSLITPFLPDG